MRGKAIIGSMIAVVVSVALPTAAALASEDAAAAHWNRPPAPHRGQYSLRPSACKVCHADQYRDWTGSLHRRAVGPGLMAQLDPKRDPATAASCFFCHAPLPEQAEMKEGAGGEYAPNAAYDRTLEQTGVTCAACHSRGGKVYGPKKREGFKPAPAAGSNEPDHGGFTALDLFSDARFCAACHQMDEGYSLNGKLLTNTYNEWKASPYARDGVVCQDCHMPDRRHLWRGIHDKEMTLSALSIEPSVEKDRYRLTIRNIGAGHYFPTYVTPMVEVKGYRVDAAGKMTQGSQWTGRIGRKVSLDLSVEEFDTRIAPGGEFVFNYPRAPARRGEKIIFEIWVYPDLFYANFFDHAIGRGGDGMKVDLLKQASKNGRASPYLLWKEERPAA